MRRFFFCILLVIIHTFTLHAQDFEESPEYYIFPLTLALEGVKHAGVWQPDWPLELPPDAFKVVSAELSRAAISGEDFFFSVNYGKNGLAEEFPLILNGKMAQVYLSYNDNAEISKMIITFPEDDRWEMEFLEYSGFFPVLVRAFRSGLWYFIYFFESVSEIRETWYDVDGNFLGAYTISLADIGKERRIWELRDFSVTGGDTEFYYDSRGLLTEKSGPYGMYKALYFREDLPRYWERSMLSESQDPNSGNFTLQWDAGGMLLRVSGEPDLADFRYEYTLDDKGNWIERREIRMINRLGLLIPSRGITIKRVLEYKKQ